MKSTGKIRSWKLYPADIYREDIEWTWASPAFCYTRAQCSNSASMLHARTNVTQTPSTPIWLESHFCRVILLLALSGQHLMLRSETAASAPSDACPYRQEDVHRTRTSSCLKCVTFAGVQSNTASRYWYTLALVDSIRSCTTGFLSAA